MITEYTDTYNKNNKYFVENLYKLRCIETQKSSNKTKYRKAKPIINKILNKLIESNNYLLFRPFWEELHDRMVFYYDYVNEKNLKNKIPIFFTTLHNEVVKWWLKAKKENKLSGTLIHFDTHDDMGLPDTSKFLLKNNSKLNENGIIKGACGQIYWPITCILLSKEIDHIIWALPKWVYDDNNSFEQVLICDGNNIEYIRSKKEPKDKFRLEGDVVLVKDNELNPKLYTFYHLHHLDRLKLATKSNWGQLVKIINTNKFVLDIDLDFFVANGDKATLTEYKKNFNDLESTGRVHGLPGKTNPRELYSDYNSKNFDKKLKTEVNLIKKRVEVFLTGLKILKDNGIKPSCINISDSTCSLFSGNYKRAVFTNEYTPKYYVPLLHDLLTKGFKKLGFI